MLWLIFTFTAIVLLSVKNLLARVWSQQSQNQTAFAFFFNIFAAVIAIIFSFIVNKGHLPWIKLSQYGILLFILNTIIYSISDRSIWVAAKHLPASTLSIIMTLAGLVYFVFSVYLYHEQISYRSLLGALLTIVATLLVSGQIQAPKTKKGLLFALIAGLSIGVASSLDKLVSLSVGINFYNYAIWIVPTIFILLIPPLSFSTLTREWKLINKPQIAVMAFFNVTGYFAFLSALRMGQVFRVITFTQFITLLTTIGGIIILKEKENLSRILLAGVLATIGAVLLV